MKNSQKIDINLEADANINDEELSEEERCQGYYETALRYINIAKYMKQYEDQDKYYHKALKNLRKARAAIPGLGPMIKDVVRKKYYARTKGKIDAYEEACKIRDTAVTPTDYLSAQTLFDRIYRYEQTHQIREQHVSKELFEKVSQYNDCEEQARHCGELAEKLMAKQRRKSLISSSLIILCIIGLLIFSRTTAFRICLAGLYDLSGHEDKAWHYYDYAWQHTHDISYLRKYKECRYQAALEASKVNNREEVRESFRELARLGYKDSEERLVALEKARIVELADGEKIRFGEINWRILSHEDGKVLLIKNKTVGNTPFQSGGGKTDWAHSSIRSWLNNTYINELFSFKLEKEAILKTKVSPSDNSVYHTKGGEATTDRLFLLSDQEQLQYAAYIPRTKHLWWLRTPGSTESTVSFVTFDKSIMRYGYESGSTSIKARPAIWVDVSDVKGVKSNSDRSKDTEEADEKTKK